MDLVTAYLFLQLGGKPEGSLYGVLCLLFGCTYFRSREMR